MLNNFDQTKQDAKIIGLFPNPVYVTKRDSNLDSTEEKEIESIIKEGTCKVGDLDYYTNDTYIFDSKLKNLKEFCEHHIKIYVKEVLSPKEELDFYITTSWLNVVEPGGDILQHTHANSIVSGVFYISTEDGDGIKFIDPNIKLRDLLQFEPKDYHVWNSTGWSLSSKKNELMLFPGWLNHQVVPNEKASTDRISLSFNTFVKGIFGEKGGLSELILK